jgi:hypothetical protein
MLTNIVVCFRSIIVSPHARESLFVQCVLGEKVDIAGSRMDVNIFHDVVLV